MLKPSARTSSLVPSVIANRRERRMSTYQMFGCLKKLRGTSEKRFAPPEPFAPPPGVEPLKPKLAGAMLPPMLPVKRAPENAFKIGAIVQPLKMCLAAPSLKGVGLYTTLATNFCRRSKFERPSSAGWSNALNGRLLDVNVTEA